MGEKTNQIINSWSVAIRHMWELPFNSHRYFLEPLGGLHAKTLLICRYISFIQNVRKSQRPAAIYLLQKIQKNVCTVTGKNIAYILRETDCDDIFKLKTEQVKKSLKFSELKDEDKWKIDFVKEIVAVKQNELHINNDLMTTEELNDILSYITTC